MTRLGAAAAAAALIACREHEAVPAGGRVGPALVAALTAADQAREPWRCAAPDGPIGREETFAIAGRSWRLVGRALALSGSGDVAIGVVADAAGSAPATLAALGRLQSRFDRVDLVVSLGGMGATARELGAVFSALADGASWPLVALPGDLEPVAALTEAIAGARRRGAVVIDGRLLQRIELPGATVGLMPGARAASRLTAGAEGCQYAAAGVTAVVADLAPRRGVRILASTEPPRVDGEPPTGELAVTARPGAIDVALYAATGEAATAAQRGIRDGSATPVTPGSSDATPRLSARRRVPTAGVLRVHDGAWTWELVADDR